MSLRAWYRGAAGGLLYAKILFIASLKLTPNGMAFRTTWTLAVKKTSTVTNRTTLSISTAPHEYVMMSGCTQDSFISSRNTGARPTAQYFAPASSIVLYVIVLQGMLIPRMSLYTWKTMSMRRATAKPFCTVE